MSARNEPSGWQVLRFLGGWCLAGMAAFALGVNHDTVVAWLLAPAPLWLRIALVLGAAVLLLVAAVVYIAWSESSGADGRSV